MTIVVLQAHPDDEAIFTGATIRRLANSGARVVLVTATLGELGVTEVSLRRGETLAQRRTAELEQAAEILGVHRLVLLGHRDSGLPGDAANFHPQALASANVEQEARRIADIIETENADALLFDDDAGIYGHPDHVAMNRIGACAARLTGVTGYKTTVDREYLHHPLSRSHLIHAASRAAGFGFGVDTEHIGVRVEATEDELVAKQAAIVAHASQISPEAVPEDVFSPTYGLEWYLSGNEPGILETLTARPVAVNV